MPKQTIKIDQTSLNDQIKNDFMSYILSGNIFKLEELLSNTITIVNYTDNDRRNGLHLIIESNINNFDKISIINILIKNGIDINQKDNFGNTPFLLACKKNDIDLIYVLLKHKKIFDIDVNSLKQNPLHFFSKGNAIEIKSKIKPYKFIPNPNNLVTEMNISKSYGNIHKLYEKIMTNKITCDPPIEFNELFKHIFKISKNSFGAIDSEQLDQKKIKIITNKEINDQEKKIEIKKLSNYKNYNDIIDNSGIYNDNENDIDDMIQINNNVLSDNYNQLNISINDLIQHSDKDNLIDLNSDLINFDNFAKIISIWSHLQDSNYDVYTSEKIEDGIFKKDLFNDISDNKIDKFKIDNDKNRIEFDIEFEKGKSILFKDKYVINPVTFREKTKAPIYHLVSNSAADKGSYIYCKKFTVVYENLQLKQIIIKSSNFLPDHEIVGGKKQITIDFDNDVKINIFGDVNKILITNNIDDTKYPDTYHDMNHELITNKTLSLNTILTNLNLKIFEKNDLFTKLFHKDYDNLNNLIHQNLELNSWIKKLISKLDTIYNDKPTHKQYIFKNKQFDKLFYDKIIKIKKTATDFIDNFYIKQDKIIILIKEIIKGLQKSIQYQSIQILLKNYTKTDEYFNSFNENKFTTSIGPYAKLQTYCESIDTDDCNNDFDCNSNSGNCEQNKIINYLNLSHIKYIKKYILKKVYECGLTEFYGYIDIDIGDKLKEESVQKILNELINRDLKYNFDKFIASDCETEYNPKYLSLTENFNLKLNKDDDTIIDFIRHSILWNLDDKNQENKLVKFLSTDYFSSQINKQKYYLCYNKNIFEKLISEIDVNARDLYGNTALMLAVKNKNLFTISELLNNHANILSVNNNRQNVFDIVTDELLNICNYFNEDYTSITFKNEDFTNDKGDKFKSIIKIRYFTRNKEYRFEHEIDNFKVENDLLTVNFKDSESKYIDLSNNIIYIMNLKYSKHFKQKILQNLNNDNIMKNHNKIGLLFLFLFYSRRLEKFRRKKKFSTKIKQLIDGNCIGENKTNKIKILIANPLIRYIYKNKSEYTKFKFKDINGLIKYFNNSEDPSTFLKALEKTFERYQYYNLHGFLNRIIKCQINIFRKHPENNNVIRSVKDKLKGVNEVLGLFFCNYIDKMNDLDDNLKDNEIFKEYFNNICFTIDRTVGDSFKQVLIKLFSSYFDINIAKEIVTSLKGYLYNDGDDFSILTKYMVSNMLNVQLVEEGETQFYHDINETTIFNNIIELLENNKIINLNSNNKYLKFKDNITNQIRHIINVYFKTYYQSSINLLIQIHQNYLNLIENQIVNLRIFIKLLDCLL